MAVTTVLVLRALGVGDLLVAVPALRGLRAAFGGARIVLAAPGALGELASLTGAVDEVLPTGGLGELAWAGEPPAVAVNLHGRGPESSTDLVRTRPSRLLTHRHPDHPALHGPAWEPRMREARRSCRLLAHYGIAADPDDLALARPTVPSPAPGAVVVHPGAAFGARRWPAARFAEVAGALAAWGRRVVVTGSAAERELAGSVASRAGLGPDAVLAGRTGLAALAALVADAALVVCGDTGVGHLATAYGTPSVLLFGPVAPSRWGPPPGTGNRHAVLWSGCPGDPFAGAPGPGLLRITPADVLEAAELVRQGVPHG
ncbi:glycosyltransferase family 9 protein [Amycolatopsis rhizosphaerae]|uniref:Glycosyltransferase family 9 protein n=1 Tax=Amycolatopsis rhizosphaerae TaxID=2053003 RepID=A0A558BC30_9PSEU|nr:glycosyltransferase family 9 protein [Amycolatopsis rhizosphaerae]TVT34065.1 glycosyltransferase family 9 protein [Amycolatopsis rhizosphaerae]